MLERELEMAIEAVTRACALCASVSASFSDGEALTKTDRSPVTIADLGAQALIIGTLRREFPSDSVVAEEDAAMLRSADGAALRGRVMDEILKADGFMTSDKLLEFLDSGGSDGGARGRFWTLDPVDGTKGFIRGGQYAVALALVENGHPALGVLGCPRMRTSDPALRGWIYHAVRGGGAWRRPLGGGEPARIRVRAGIAAAEAIVCESFEKEHTAQSRSARIAAVLGARAEPLRMDSQCKYAAVAGGEADIYMRLPVRADYEEKIWDHAAGALIVEEAGGCVTDTIGRALDFSQGRTLRNNLGVLASGGALHAALLAAVQEIQAGDGGEHGI